MGSRRSIFLTGFSVGLLWLGLLVWVALDLFHAREETLASSQAQQSTLARVLEGNLQLSVQTIDLQLRDFVSRYQNDIAAGAPRSQVEPGLTHNLGLFPQVLSFRVADENGNYRYDASGELATRVNIADRDYFQRLKNDPRAGLVMAAPIYSRVSSEWVMTLARRLSDSHGRFQGVVLSSIKLSYFEGVYQALGMGQGAISIWSRDQRLVLRWPKTTHLLGHRFPNVPVLQRVIRGEQDGSFVHQGILDGTQRVFAFRAVTGTPFVVVVSRNVADVLAPWYARVGAYLGLMGCLTLALGAFFWVWLRGLVRAENQAQQMTLAFQKKEREGRALLDSIPDSAWLVDREGRFLAVNEAFCRRAGKAQAAVLGLRGKDLFGEAMWPALREGQQATYRLGGVFREERQLDLGEGSRPYEVVRVPVRDERGDFIGLAGVARDISSRYEAQERQRLITHFFDHGTEAMLVLDGGDRITTCNHAFTQLSGYDSRSLTGQAPDCLVADHQGSALLLTLADTLQREEGWRGEAWVRRRDGGDCPVRINLSLIRDDGNQVTHKMLFLSDLSDKRADTARIESLSNLDQLTALPNRLYFSHLLDNWLAMGRRGGLIVLDLDRLARINDAYGHEAGDQLLRRLGERLRRALGESDVLGRLGGDQFGVLTASREEGASVEMVAQKLLEFLARPVHLEAADVVTSACAGICLFPDDGTTASDLMRNVDAAMHQAKFLGQGSYQFFAPEMNVRMAERLRLENDLRWALDRNELVLYYQPQVDLETGRVVGVEALIRWQHPELGLVMPDSFIPLAEETRLIVPIGAWALKEACRQAKAWQAESGENLLMAVNLSAIQFQDNDVVAQVSEALVASGLAPRWLELEITESVLMGEPEKMIPVLTELKTLGARLAIDDFGTGYSSLAYLKRFPIDKIKIDRSFIRDLERSPGDEAIVRMVVAMARELDRQVIAEGVETEGQLAFLRRHGCHEYQGFYCSRPVPGSRIPALRAAMAEQGAAR